MNTDPNPDTPNFCGLPGTMAVVFGLVALLLGFGGGWLPWLGGSAYYLLMAVGLLVVALLLHLGAGRRQYVPVVAGGHGSLGTKTGDSVLAHALPRDSGAR
ncbi:MAG: hypothetical protein ABIX12_03290 [Rubrivivax sp.]